ncbi:MAG TPA: tripartite tricarboxylate transporter TctB family protein [Pseudonocardia sp.]|nr:tripartite tricarboxylate transporter TctB family protein [Pseudonocardia sp.]
MSEVTQDGATTTPRRRPRPAHLSRGALIVPAVLVALGIFLVVGTVGMDVVGDGGVFGPTAMPWAVAVLCFVVAAALAVDILRPRPEYDTPTDPPSTPVEADTEADTGAGAGTGADTGAEPAPEPETVNARAVGIAVGGVAGFIVVLPWLGWILSATLLFTTVAIALGNRRYPTCLLAGLAVASVIQIVFSGLLGISLPAGFVGGF